MELHPRPPLPVRLRVPVHRIPVHRRVRRALRVVCCWLLLLIGATAAAASSRENLDAIADDFYWALQERELRPKLTPQGNAAWLRKLKKLQRRLAHIKVANLDQQGRITRRLLRADLRGQRAYVERGWITEDLNGTVSLMQTIIDAVSASENRTVNDWRWTIKTLRHAERFVGDYIELLERGIREGRTRSKPAVRSAIRVLRSLSSESARNNPLVALEAQLERSMKDHPRLPGLRRELHEAIHRRAVPAHRRLREFLQTKYLPKASELGENRERYLYHMAKHLGPDHSTPEEIHRFGREEVNRLLGELKREAKRIAPETKSLERFMRGLTASSSYRDGKQLIQAAETEVGKAKELARAHLPVPRSEVRVEPVSAHEEATVEAQYMPTGEREGVMQVNTGKLLRGQRTYNMATLVTHEVYGGHHLAAMYAQKQRDLPAYRREAANTAFDEGWALYSEQLRDEQGGFEPRERVGFLVNHLWRAARLVVDTGLHTKTMSEREAVDYFRRATFASPENAKAEIARYIDWPGQALAYYLGKRQLIETRRTVEKMLGPHFDPRRYHAKLLSQGAIPPAELHRVMVGWAHRRAGQLRGRRAERSRTSRRSTPAHPAH